MPLKIEICRDEDMTRAFAIISAAFGHNPYMDGLYPGHDTVQGRKTGGERLLSFKKNDPNTHFLKAVDTETGFIVGVAKWNIYNGVIPDEVGLDGDYWPTEEDKEYANCLWAAYLKPRRKSIKDTQGFVASLDILTVDPEMQSRGAGRKLLEWGTKEADKLALMAVVEATDNARHVYETAGFQRQYEYVTPLPHKFETRGRQAYNWMIRPAKECPSSI